MNICHLVKFFLTDGLHEWKHLPCWKLKNTYSQGQCRQRLMVLKFHWFVELKRLINSHLWVPPKIAARFSTKPPSMKPPSTKYVHTSHAMTIPNNLFSLSLCSLPHHIHSLYSMPSLNSVHQGWITCCEIRKSPLYTEVVGTAGRRLCGQWFV